MDNEKEIINQPAELAPETAEVIGVQFKVSGKTYYFDPDGQSYAPGAHAIVETARGLEYGYVSMGNTVVSGKELVLPLRKALREATEEDEKHNEENKAKEQEAFVICAERIEKHRLGMKLVDAEYTFDNSKLLFYFSAEGRVDFRDLVKDLASVFRTRIELRQIGIRDEAKMIGGFGLCGRPFCCSTFLPDFVQVSIKMAKEQNLSLNSAKISGACGRLMCCLRFEHETYEEEIKKTPKVDSVVSTPDGEGVVVEALPLTGVVKVRLSKDKDQIKEFSRDDCILKKKAKSKEEIFDEDLKKLEKNN
ncbi:MAG: stage 0 sporulation family protein [Clostridiales bacterium]|nr:stage 0 sporulation family protein [Clostridiales bacterium]